MLTKLFLFLSLFAYINSTQVDYTQLTTGVWLSGAAYCGKEQYASMQIGGPAIGFAYKDMLYDAKTDLQGYIGVLTTTKTIYVVIRGSSSKMNWLDDFEVRKVDYTTYPECHCKVHNGFYRSALGVSNYTINAVKTLQKSYPTYSIVVTGHSYGASSGQLLAMELERNGIKTKVYNYGQPRVGDTKYATFVNSVISEYFRTTHNKDTVPHVPPIDGFGYYHSCREIFEDADGNLTECSEADCEDPKCADQYSLIKTSTDDHLYYLGHRVSCEESTI
jgi:predicted lipase